MRGYRFNLKFKWFCIKGKIDGFIEFIPDLPQPRNIKLFVTKEINNMLQFKLVLPEASAPDVVTQEVSVVIDGADPILVSASVLDTEILSDEFVGVDNATVETTLVQIDDAGNRSPERVQSFVLTDTIPPAQPGEIGLVITAEV